MSRTIRIAMDAMGGDYAPVETVKAAVNAVNEREDIEMILTGDEPRIEAELAKYQYRKEQISIVHTTEVVSCNESPVDAIRKKKDSSMAVSYTHLCSIQCAAFESVHAGSPN